VVVGVVVVAHLLLVGSLDDPKPLVQSVFS